MDIHSHLKKFLHMKESGIKEIKSSKAKLMRNIIRHFHVTFTDILWHLCDCDSVTDSM